MDWNGSSSVRLRNADDVQHKIASLVRDAMSVRQSPTEHPNRPSHIWAYADYGRQAAYHAT